MTRPRPSRKARWAIGLSFVGLFALITLGGTAVAFTQVVSGLSESGGFGDGYSGDGWADTEATATILDVDVYDLDDQKVARTFDREDGDAGYAEVDIGFTTNGRAVDGDTSSVTWMDWPDDLELPDVGDEIEIEYHAEDPENDPRLADSEKSGTGTVLGPAADGSAVQPATHRIAASTADSGDGTGVSSAVRWTTVISGLLTMLSLVGTLLWVRGAPAPEKAPTAPLGWNQTGWNQTGWNQTGWNQTGWNQAGWNQAVNPATGWGRSSNVHSSGGPPSGWGQSQPAGYAPSNYPPPTYPAPNHPAPNHAANHPAPNHPANHPARAANPPALPSSPPPPSDWQQKPPPSDLTPPS